MKAPGWRVWGFTALMAIDVTLAAAFVHHLYGLLFLFGAVWFATCAAREASEPRPEGPDEQPPQT